MTDGASAPLCCLVNEEQTSGLADYPSQCDPPQWRINRDLDVDLDVVPRFCEGEPEQLLCNEQTALDRYRDYIVENGPAGEAFIGFVAGGDRNRSYRNGALLREIEGFVHAADGTLRLDAVLLQNPSLSVEIQSRFGIDTCALEVRLTALTDAVNDGHTVSSPTDGSLHFPLDTTQCPDIAAVP